MTDARQRIYYSYLIDRFYVSSVAGSLALASLVPARAAKGRTPIVATSANVMPDQMACYRENGIDGVVAKPISPAALISEVARPAPT